jgi:hypothetical protein
MSEIDKLIIKLLEVFIIRQKLNDLGREEESYTYVLTEVDLLCDIFYLINDKGKYTYSNAIELINKYLEYKFGINLNDYDSNQIIREMKINYLNL